MTKQQTIERITEYLPYLGEDVLQGFLTLLERVQPDLDAWDRSKLASTFLEPCQFRQLFVNLL